MGNQKLMNKKGMLMRDWVIMIILFSVFVGIAGLIVYDMSDATQGYNVQNMTDSNFDSQYNQVDTITRDVTIMANATTSKEGLGLVGTVELFFGSTIAVIQIVFGSLSIVSSVFDSMGTSFGIPPAISNLIFPGIIAIITTVLIFVVVSSLTKTKV